MKNKLLFLIATIIFLFSACSENPPSKEAIMENGEKIITMADKEGLTAHANSIKVRLKDEC